MKKEKVTIVFSQLVVKNGDKSHGIQSVEKSRRKINPRLQYPKNPDPSLG